MDKLEFFGSIVVAIFASNGLWSFIAKKAEKKSVFNEGLLAILHDRLYELAKEYISRGKITIAEFENLTYLYEPYTKMGGNGTNKELYERCKRLHMGEHDEEKN